MDAVLRLLNGLLMLAAPLALGAILARRLRAPWSLYGAGAAGFLGSQVLHIPFNLAVLNPAIQRAGLVPGAGFPGEVLGPALLGLSAGLFEEPARYLVYRWVGRQGRSWAGGLMLGAGHGGLEAILLGLLVLYGFFQAVAYQGAELSALLPAEQAAAAQANLNAYWSAPAPAALLGAVERLLAICIQLGLSILVLQSIRKRNALWLVLAVGWHALVDGAALVALAAWGTWATEGVIALFALASLGAVFGLRDRGEATAQEPTGRTAATDPPAIPTAADRPPQAWTERPERLEDSRYLEE
jgi:uncharacterized membrane protein YhfC